MKTGNLCGFIDDFIGIVNEAKVWEFWLSKETGKSWSDFKLSVIPQEADTKALERAEHDAAEIFMKGVLV